MILRAIIIRLRASAPPADNDKDLHYFLRFGAFLHHYLAYICSTVDAVFKTNITNCKTKWITCKSLSLHNMESKIAGIQILIFLTLSLSCMNYDNLSQDFFPLCFYCP